jgi:Zn-dependent protease with chaperone function
MQVGRWVYISQQIASHVVTKRDALDKALRQITGVISLNVLLMAIAATGWILRLMIWSIRLMIDAIFRLQLIAQRALLRQMEFQADLVAVSLTGSDPPVQALHKMQAADQGARLICAAIDCHYSTARGARHT